MIRALLVEDDMGLAGNIIDYLELEDMVCDHAANGVAAMSLIQKHPFDVVVLDISMPNLNGFDAGEKLKKILPDVKLIFLTQNEDPGMVTEAAPRPFEISSQAPAVRNFKPLRSSSVFTGLRECKNASAVRVKHGIEITPNLSSLYCCHNSRPPASYIQCSIRSESIDPA